MPGIGVVLNPHSKRYREHPEQLKRMGFVVGDKGSIASTKDLLDIRRVAEEFKQKEIDILALSGGDGTNHRTLTTFLEVYGDRPLPKITFLRGGTLNTIAFACGIFGSPEKILANLLYKYHEDEPFETIEVNLMKINDKYGFIWGCGMVPRFMEAYYQGGIPSPAKAVWTLTRAVGSAVINGPFVSRILERMDAEVIVNGRKWPFRNYSAIFAGSIEYLGLGARVFYHAKESKKFHLIGFSMTPRGLLPHIPHLFLGRPSKCRDLLQDAASEVVVQLSEPAPFNIDGDQHSAVDRFEIRLGPRLTVLVK